MPITRKQFELGINSDIEAWMKKIHGFLAEHKEEAFTLEELLQAFDLPTHLLMPKGPSESEEERGPKLNRDRQLVEAALDKLVDLGMVLERAIKGKTYYGLGERPLSL